MGNVISGLISGTYEVLFSRCVDCTARNATYISELEDNVNALRNEFQKLIEARDDVLIKVVNAEQRQMKRLNKVQGWLSRVEAEETEVRKLIRDSYRELEKLCLGGYCSTSCKSSYKFGKKVAKKLPVVQALIAEEEFPGVAGRLPEPAVDERSIEPTIVGLQPLFNKVWNCLGQGQVGIVGIYGMGGVGKTTLLTQINNKFVDVPCEFDFDVVIWVVVSKDLQLESIQEKIARKVSLFNDSWKNKSLEEKASDIYRILSKKKFVLLLDDVWEHVDLIKIGIPHPSLKKSSKVVFTTREYEVCGKMEAYKCFKVECLGHDDAWELFQKKVGRGTLDSHPDIPQLAKTITEECCGLPLALITVGRAMASKKSPEEWKHAIKVLRKTASDFSGMEKHVFSRLKFSYDNLFPESVKSCFLYCCLFPEDYNIDKEELIDCWVGEGFLDEYNDNGVRDEGHYIIGVLLSACLLEESDNFIKMHDVVRDMAIWLVCNIEQEKENILILTGVGLTNPPKVPLWKEVKSLSLINNKIENLLETPTCLHLQTLFLNRNEIQMITDNFFQFMPFLKVLNLSDNNSLTQLPAGISILVSLQHLDLSGTPVRELPIELKALVNLKCVGLEYTPRLKRIPHQLISNMSKLQVLRMVRCCSSLPEKGDNVLYGDGESLVDELISLKDLNVLTISLRSFHALQRFLSSVQLQSSTQFLELQGFVDSKSLEVSSLTDLNHLHTLSIGDCSNLEEFKIDGVGEIKKSRDPYAFHNLLTVKVWSCHKLRDMTLLVFVPNIKLLSISSCGKMEEIISSGKLGEDIMTNLSPFPKLQSLVVSYLPNLKSIYGKALPFPHLKEIYIRACPELKKLPFDSKSAKESKIVIKGEKDWWTKLNWEDEATQNAFLPCFKELQWHE